MIDPKFDQTYLRVTLRPFDRIFYSLTIIFVGAFANGTACLRVLYCNFKLILDKNQNSVHVFLIRSNKSKVAGHSPLLITRSLGSYPKKVPFSQRQRSALTYPTFSSSKRKDSTGNICVMFRICPLICIQSFESNFSKLGR